MKSLYEKLNRLDDSLVESKRVVKKKKLTESVEEDKKKLFDAAASVKCKLDDATIEYAMYDVDDFIENELVYCGKLLLSECPDMLFWRYVSDEDFGSYCAVYESDEEFADAFYQISHDRVYDITDEVNGDYDYDDDIDEMLTEGNNVSSQLPPALDSFLQDIAQMYETITYKDIMEHEYTEEDLKKLKNYRRRFRAEIPYEGDEETDKMLQDIAEKVAVIVKNNKLTETMQDTVTLESIAKLIIDYAEEHPESLRNFRYMFDYINDLSERGVWSIPAALDDFVPSDPDNITEEEAEVFIDLLLNKTDVGDKLVQIKSTKTPRNIDILKQKFPMLSI